MASQALTLVVAKFQTRVAQKMDPDVHKLTFFYFPALLARHLGVYI